MASSISKVIAWFAGSLRKASREDGSATVGTDVQGLAEPEPQFLSRYILHYVFLHEINIARFQAIFVFNTYTYLEHHDHDWHTDGEIAGARVKPIPKKTSVLAQIGLAYDICSATTSGRQFLTLLTAAAALWLLQRRPFFEDLYDQVMKEQPALHRNLNRIMSFCIRTRRYVRKDREGKPHRISNIYPSLDTLCETFGSDCDQGPTAEPAAELKRSPSLPSFKQLGSVTPPAKEAIKSWTPYHSNSTAVNR